MSSSGWKSFASVKASQKGNVKNTAPGKRGMGAKANKASQSKKSRDHAEDVPSQTENGRESKQVDRRASATWKKTKNARTPEELAEAARQGRVLAMKRRGWDKASREKALQAKTVEEKMAAKSAKKKRSRPEQSRDGGVNTPACEEDEDEAKLSEGGAKDEEDAQVSGGASKRKREAEGAPATVIFVGNLSYSTTQELIEEHFAFAKPTRVRLPTDKATGKIRGFAFVEFGDSSKLEAILKVHHTKLEGRKINVELTAGGGGKGESRAKKLKDKNDDLAKWRTQNFNRKGKVPTKMAKENLS